MIRRKKLGLVFEYDERWIGGTYYVLNIIHALNTLDKSKKPEITIISVKDKSFAYVKKTTQYPFLSFIKVRRKRRRDSLVTAFSNLEYVFKPQTIKPEFDMVFPNPAENYVIKNEASKCYWIADFQEDHLPELFSEDDIVARKQYQLKIAIKAQRLILSSNDALQDYERLYPFAKVNPLLLPFAVSNINFSPVELELLQNQFAVNDHFFFCANQFWSHKNHIVVLEAVNRLKKEGTDIQVLFSGKDHDYRNSDILNNLKKYVRDNNLSEHIVFLGFIDRNDMLNLMSNAAAVIQPSLFEGWSTVNEDAKSLGKYIIASDINIHKEQLQSNYSLFKSGDHINLAEAIKDFMNVPPEMVETDYQENIKIFAEKFYNYI